MHLEGDPASYPLELMSELPDRPGGQLSMLADSMAGFVMMNGHRLSPRKGQAAP